MKTKSTRDKPKKITQSELARKLGITRQLLAYHVKTGNAPALEDFDGWVAYLEANGRDGSLPPEFREKIAAARLRVLDATAVKMETENLARRKEMISRPKAERFVSWITALFFGELERAFAVFPSSLVGKHEVEINKECTAEQRRIEKSLRFHLDRWTATKGDYDGGIK